MRQVLLIFLIITYTGCQNKPDSRSTAVKHTGADLIEINKTLISEDRKTISEFVGKSDLKFTETGTGLWYSILNRGSGDTVRTGDNVSFDFECKLLNGNPCYSGTQTIRVGYTGAESGVTEGLQMMQEGSDFMFIIPPYLAYGLTGDGDRIPGRAILIYRIRIKDII
jgi:FKBP-type peptidyl-prolyl cis-trans isomerase